MSIRNNDIYNIFYDLLSSIVDDLRRDFIETQQDQLISLRREVFHKFYAVENIKRDSEKVPVGFVDAGFKPYQLDVSIIIPIQISGIVRDENGKLHKIKNLLDKPVNDFLMLYSSRKRRENKYIFTIKIKSFYDNSLLFNKREDAEEASREINKLLLDISGSTIFESPKSFVRLTKYIEGLLELAYALKLLLLLEENGSIVPRYIVLDGTLIKWFSIPRSPRGVDGLDILSIILGISVDEIKKYLFRIVGLSKTSKFTNIIRSHSLFHAKKPDIINGRGLYSLVDLEGIGEAAKILEEYWGRGGSKDFVRETIHIFNRIVYSNYGVYVSRFPITPDYKNVFILDIYLDQPIIDLGKEKVVVNKDKASNVNPYISYIVNTMMHYRTRAIGEPPFGYMEIDNDVRFREDRRKFFEQAFRRILRSRGDLSSRILEQVFSPTTRMRYGYR
ncbi:hypothetical protein [Staphylothermus hellenicus]|uniref:NurA domain-containing protein n=1 Tax=Staphylothermus hellenicus (strain DSM 12710 / JCM 10830 / BK20S6-10-b1 / P8) TaxID=591019 RepID=D7DCG4_STAHD|nr:hypothetical protein [Staphylothermus hellenicus]ADI31861.1 hypothetical protein Shell_0743 [Staphylothermus hellenicus DSM 12710]